MPDSGLSWNWGCSTDFLFQQGVDDTRLSDVRISDKTDTDIFLISVEDVELSEQVDQWPLSERIGDWGLVCNGWVLLGQVLYPFFQVPHWNQVSLVDQKHHVFMGTVLLHVFLQSQWSGSERVSSIQDLYNNVAAVHDLVKFLPDSFTLASWHSFVSVLNHLLILVFYF